MTDLTINDNRKQGRDIKVFSDSCQSCKDHIIAVEIGKCGGCNLQVIDMKIDTNRPIIQKYNIKKHPTTIIDNEIRVDGEPDFYWQCGDAFYEKLKNKYSLQETS